jgi:hypothetical protein
MPVPKPAHFLRREILAANGWSLRDLYRTLETPGAIRLRDAKAALDSAVRAAYGMNATEDTLAFLLALNLELADKGAKWVSMYAAASTRPGWGNSKVYEQRMRHSARR